MSQSIRYQVFVSSTFTDLKEERAEVLQAIWELDCIPTGMEAFVATNESQWEVIRKVIDECDYYVLIIGGRYGSIASDGISYTEKEYDYAKSLGIPVLAFVHGEPENIAVSKAEKDDSGRARLSAFRSRVMGVHPVKTWTNAQELGGVVSRSISREIKVNPRPGWIRNTGTSNLDLLEQINALTKENTKLKEKASTQDKPLVDISDLESGTDRTKLMGILSIYNKNTNKTETLQWKSEASWDDIFREIGPSLMNEAKDVEIRKMLSIFYVWSEQFNRDLHEVQRSNISSDTFGEVIVQLRALGLIDRGTRKRAVSDNGNYWCLTQRGERYLITISAKKKGQSVSSLPDL